MAGEVRIPIGLNTDTALQDAKKLGEGVKKTLANIDMTQANSKTMTFIKNLTSAYSRMQKLADETERLAKTKLPTEDYVYFSKQLEIAQKQLAKLQQKQEQIESDRATLRAREKSILLDMEKTEAAIETARVSKNQDAMQEASSRLRMLKEEQAKLPTDIQKLDDLWRKVGGRIDEFTPRINDLTAQMEQLVEQNEAFTSGKETDAYKQKENALHLQAQAVNILLMRYAEMNDASTANVFNSNRETEAIERETRATKELSNARRELSGGRGGVVRGPARYKKRGISRGPALDTVDNVKFSKQGETVAELSRYAQAENEVAEATDKATESTQRSTNAMRTYGSSLGDVCKNILVRMKSALNRLVSAFKQLAHHLHSSHRSHSGLMGNMKHSLSMILRYTLGIRSLFMLIRRIRSYTKEAFKVMAQEIPEVNQNLSQLGHSFKELKAGFGTMLQPLLKALTPLLDNILQKIVSMMNAIGRFFATLSGQDYVYEATVANYDYAESVKEAEGALASFDKLNVISKSKNDLSLTTDTVTYKKVKINPEDKWYTQLAKDIKEGWEKADLSDATHGIAEKLATWLDGIKWEDIEKKSTKFAHTLATGINGITLPDEDTGKSHLATSIGKTLAAALQTAINTFDTFITDINWENLGKFIGDAIESFKDKLRENSTWEKAGAAFGHLFQGLITLGFQLFVEDNVLEGFGDDLSHMLNSFLDEGFKINPKTKRTYFEDFGEIVTTGIIEFLEEIEKFLDGSSGKLGKAINKFMQGARLKDLFLTLARVLIKGIFYGISLLVQGAAGALGIDIDDSTAMFIAEALGIGALGIKIGKLVGGITGSGGLLSAFSKKDRALGNQRRALGLETVAATVLGGALGFLGGKALTSAGNIDTLTDSVKNVQTGIDEVAVPSLDRLAQGIDNVADAGKIAATELSQSTSDAITDMNTQFDTFTPSINEVDTSSYNNAIAVTQQTISTLESMWANAKLKAPTPTYETPESSSNPSTAPTKASRIATTQKDPNKSFVNDTSVGVPSTSTSSVISGAPYYDLQQHNMEVTAELNAQRQATIDKNVAEFEEWCLNGLSTDDQKIIAKLLNDYATLVGYTDLNQIWSDDRNTQAAINDVTSHFREIKNGKEIAPKDYTGSLIKGLENLLKWLPIAGSAGFGFPIPFLARGAVIPPNQPFLAMLGDQRSGTNVETPLSTIKQAVAEVLANMQIKNTFNVKGDPNSIFRVVLDETKIFYNQHGYSPFPSET